MNKKIMYSILILLSFCFIDNVDAESKDIYEYTYNFGSNTYVITYDDINKQVCISDSCVDIVRNHFYFYWESSYLKIVQSDNGFIIHQESGQLGNGRWVYWYSTNFENNYDSVFLTTLEIDGDLAQSGVEEGGEFASNVKGWGQLVSNVDLYNEDGTIYFEKNLDVVINSKPTIEITKESETTKTYKNEEYILDLTLNIDYGIIDDNNYLYQYKYGSSSVWTTTTIIDGTSISLKFDYNDTLYVQILDKNDNYEPITTATYIVDTIEQLPDDYLEEELLEDTINSEFDLKDVIFHDCDVNLEVGYVLCKVEINNYDNSLYNYYYRIGNDSFILFRPDEKIQILPEIYDDSLLLKNNDDISLYKKWQSASDNINTYLLSLKIFKNTTIYIARENKETGERQYYTFTIDSLVDSNDMSQIEEFLYNHLLSKFYFVYQFKDIIEYVSSYDFEENAKAPQFSFDLSFIGLQTVVVDMEINESSRLLIHGYIKLFASVLVIHTFIKETTKLFNK